MLFLSLWCPKVYSPHSRPFCAHPLTFGCAPACGSFSCLRGHGKWTQVPERTAGARFQPAPLSPSVRSVPLQHRWRSISSRSSEGSQKHLLTFLLLLLLWELFRLRSSVAAPSSPKRGGRRRRKGAATIAVERKVFKKGTFFF